MSKSKIEQPASLKEGTLEEGDGTPLQYSCLENPMDGGAWWAAVHGATKSQTRLSDFTSFLFICLDESFPCSPELSQHCYSGIVLVAHQCFRLSNPMGCSPQGSSVHGILQARILEWVAILFSRRSSQLRYQTWVSCIEGGFLTF